MSLDKNGEKPIKFLNEACKSVKISDEARERVQENVFSDKRPGIFSLTSRMLLPVGAGAIAALILIGVTYIAIGDLKSGQPGTDYKTFISAVSGKATMSFKNLTRKIKSNEIIPAGSEINTETGSFVKMNIGPHRVSLFSESEMKLSSLKHKDLKFALKEGRIELKASPLEKDRRLRVFSGKQIIEVVGTLFSVARKDNCTTVSVLKGRVKVSDEENIAFISAGKEKIFCDKEIDGKQSEEADETAENNNTEGVAATDAEKKVMKEKTGEKAFAKKSKEKGANKESKPIHKREEKETEKQAPRSLSEEEALFKKANEALIMEKNNLKARGLLVAYLGKFPDGIFSEEALLNLIRLDYNAKKYRAVCNNARRFLQKITGVNHRSVEVRVIYARSALALNMNPQLVFDVFQPLHGQLENINEKFQEQIIYIYALASYRSKENETGKKWLEKYLEKFPEGKYSAQAKKRLKK